MLLQNISIHFLRKHWIVSNSYHIPSTRNIEEPEQIFVNRSGITENTGQENPLMRLPDILGQERADGPQVTDRNVSE